MSRILDWLRTFRAQTVPATVILLVSSYVAGGGSLFSVYGVILFLYGILLHMMSFGHNTVMDYFWDLNDPNKRHFPIISGRIKLNDAVNLISLGLGISFIIGVALSWGNYYATLSYFAFAMAGFLYNNWVAKTTIWGWIPIVVCFTSLGFYAMYLGGDVNVLYGLYLLFTIWFQIGWSGYLKEIEVKSQANMLRRLGVRVENNELKIPLRAKLWGISIKLGNFVVGMLMVCRLSSWYHFPQMIIASLLLGFMLGRCIVSTFDRYWDRIRELRNMSLIEIATIYAGMFIVMPLAEALVLALFGLAWFIVMNKYLWGTRLIPRV